MSDHFAVVPEQLTATSRAFAGQQEAPAGLATTLEGARAVDTGDPGLNGEIQAIVGELVAALNGLSAGLAQDSAHLAENAQDYPTGEEVVSGRLRQAGTGL